MAPGYKSQQEGKEATSYIELIDLQKAEEAVECLGNRHCQSAMVALHVAINLLTLGAIPLNTTSRRCFHSSQQHKRRKVDAASLGVRLGASVSHSLQTSLGCHRILLQKDRAKGHPDILNGRRLLGVCTAHIVHPVGALSSQV
jgi:hypothetical protein